MITPLFQKSLDSADTPVTVDRRVIAELPVDMALDADSVHALEDPQGIGYFILPGHDVRLRRAEQVSRDHTDRGDTRGLFASAWLDHGRAPQDGGYAFMVLVNPSPARWAAFTSAMQSRAPPVSISHRGGGVHAVWDRASQTWGYVFFEPAETPAPDAEAAGVPSGESPVLAADAPCLVLVETRGKTGLLVTVADPDLRLKQGVSQPGRVTVTLRGEWRIKGGSSFREVRGTGWTELSVTCRDGASYDAFLEPAG